MKTPEQFRIKSAYLPDFLLSYFIPYNKKINLAVIATREPDGWNHVSVSLPGRDPTWMEMCFVKDLFFEGEEVCLQFHPKKSEYINLHRHCLHIWQPPPDIEQYLIRE